MRTLSAALITAQQNTLAKPYIKVSINSINYWSKLLYIKQVEQPYLGYANIVLENHDRAFDSLDVTGYETFVAYGHTTGNAVAEPDGDNSTNEYSYAPELWIKEQSIISVEGESVCELYCEDAWAKLRENKVVAYGTAPYYAWTFSGYTVEALMRMIIQDVMGWTLNAPATSDGIVDVYKPEFSINNTQPETAAEILYRLISMTKSYLRVRYGHIFDIIYPQTGDAASRTFYSYQVPYFKEHQEKVRVLVPNSITVFANNPTLADPWPTPVMSGTSASAHAVYGTVSDIDYAPEIVLQADADNRAAAILTKILAEKDAGRLLIAHDNGMELYDKVAIEDNRGF